MQSAKPILLIATVSLALASAACSSVPIATGCSELARPILTTDTPHAELGNTGDPALDWQLYGVGETGQLNKANDRAKTGFGIINACEVRDNTIRAHIERPWYRRLLPG
jgi:hypothetical protein